MKTVELAGRRKTKEENSESARELWASEEYRDEAKVVNGKLVCDFKPYEVKTFGITLKAPETPGEKRYQTPVKLDYNEGLMDIPENLMRDKISVCGVDFELGNGTMYADGQTINTAEGNKLKLLITTYNSNDITFEVNGKPVVKTVNGANDAFASWDLYDFGETAYIKKGHLGYEFTHSLNDDKSIAWAKGLYYWVVTLDGTTILPKDKDLVVLAATEVSDDDYALVTPLMDEIENNRPFTFKKNFKEKLWYLQSKLLWNINDKDDYFRHNNNGKNGKRVEQSKKRSAVRTIDSLNRDIDK